MAEINGYQLIKLIGWGTFGETYEATKAGHRVALKIIRAEAMQSGFAKRFRHEVRALQKAIGPNVVKFIDAGTDRLGNEDRYFVAMEFLEGLNLRDAFINSRNKFDETELKNILTQILSGLETVNQQNIVHRDLKPANVFITNDSTVKLLDFGLVKMLDYTTLTSRPGKEIGTPLFIAPEILRGEKVDLRADFYSFGVLIYYLITEGNYPFVGNTHLELYAKVANNPPTPPTRYNRTISSEFENFVLTLLAKQPYERTFIHSDLKQFIADNPVYLSSRSKRAITQQAQTYPKKCYFSVLMNEKSDVEKFIFAGGRMDGILYPANFLPSHRASLSLFRRMGIPYFLDPVTYRFAYSSFAQTKGLVELPYIPDPNSVLTPRALQSLQAQQNYARECIDFQIAWESSPLIAPFHFCRDLESEWIDIDIKLLEESISYAKGKKADSQVYAGLCLNIEAYTVLENRMALLNRYSRARADGYLFYIDSLEERTTNSLQLRALIDLLRLFQQLGKPVIAGRVGTLGLGLLAAGIDGITNGLASLWTFSENNLLVNRASGYDMPKRYYMPKMMITLPVPVAEDILSDPNNSSLRCNCPICKGTSTNLSTIAKSHYIYVRSEEVRSLDSLTDTSQQLAWFLGRVKSAIDACNKVERQKKVDLKRTYYQHFNIWLDVFGSTTGDRP